MIEEAAFRLREIMRRVEKDAWKHVKCTTACDKNAAENAVRLIYRERGFNCPDRFFWCKSPQESGEYLNVARDLRKSLINDLWLFPRSKAAQNLFSIPEEDKSEGHYSCYLHAAYGSKSGQLRARLRGYAPTVQFGYGCQDAPWLLTLASFRNELGISTLPELKGLNALLRTGGWFAPFSKVCVMVDRPKAICTDSEGQFHCVNGPALSWRGGQKEFFWRGIEVPAKVIMAPETLSHQDLKACTNIEVRRVVLEIYGLERFISETKTKVIQEDDYGQLLKMDLPNNLEWTVNPLVVRVLNSTPEPDGSYKTYLLTVPPDTTTAKEGVAWSFGMEADEYDPLIET